MAHNKLYRNFIILQEDERGYSHSNDKALSGYAKIEAKGDKCKISFYAQNLRKEDNYSMILICCKRDLKQLVDIGPLSINDVGKADNSKEYYVNNIAGLGMSYDKISGAAICRVKDNENEFIMHGFMNGEDSSENWRKFKLVKVDSKSYSNKLDLESKKKETYNSSKMEQSNDMVNKVAKGAKLQNELVERNKGEDNLQIKENIELGNSNNNSTKSEDKCNRIPEKSPNKVENIESLESDRSKDKSAMKSHKCSKCEKEVKHYDDEYEEAINKLAKELDEDGGIIDINIDHHMHEDVIIYGFIKEKKKHDCKWKKFKLEKKCKNNIQDSMNYSGSFKRIEENFKLDKLSELYNDDRSDLIDFDKYEKGIQQGTLGNTGAGIMDQANAGKGIIKQVPIETGQTSTSINQPTEATQLGESVSQPTETMPSVEAIPKTEVVEQPTTPTNQIQQGTPTQNLKLCGTISLYFEKLAEDFQPYNANLEDINYCKWYKVNVNSIDDLSDESNYNKYTLAFYPMLNYYPYISKHGHFLLGYKCNSNGEMKYIIYAIPGSREKSDQPYGGRTGFVTWTNDNNNGLGYWLMFYDFKNSSIVIPTK